MDPGTSRLLEIFPFQSSTSSVRTKGSFSKFLFALWSPYIVSFSPSQKKSDSNGLRDGMDRRTSGSSNFPEGASWTNSFKVAYAATCMYYHNTSKEPLPDPSGRTGMPWKFREIWNFLDPGVPEVGPLWNFQGLVPTTGQLLWTQKTGSF
jgi:hypothetical protein